ncbi:MAG: transcriptional repressor [Candidatus Kuenenia sp.]|nr:transcriptional repressor [Candidatus Kuenenia hertensis]
MQTVEKLTDTLKNNGLKITPQRLMIFKVLENNTTHPSAEEIYKKVKKVYPSVSFTTIYKTLETLRDLGEIKELTIDKDRKHYDPDISTHHHFICSDCRQIHDIHEDFTANIKLDDSLIKDFSISGFQISFFGVCNKCGHKSFQDN